jgi:dihydrofolate reductase
MISIVVAVSKNGVIGKNNDLPWNLPTDRKHFKEITIGKPVIMGRKTFDSILSRLGKPLPERKNIVITRQEDYKAEGVTIAHSIGEALKLFRNETEVFVIGGSEIYKEALPFTDRIYLTQVETEIDGDARFPDVSVDNWTLKKAEAHKRDEKNEFDYTFLIYERKPAYA